MHSAISKAAWRLMKALLGNPQAAAGEPAVLDQADLLPMFGGDEDLLSAAFDELLVVPMQLGEADEPWSEFRALSSARFESREEMTLVYYQFHPDFLRLLKIMTR